MQKKEGKFSYSKINTLIVIIMKLTFFLHVNLLKKMKIELFITFIVKKKI